MSLSQVARPKENNATRQLSRILSHVVARDKQRDFCCVAHSFALGYEDTDLSTEEIEWRVRIAIAYADEIGRQLQLRATRQQNALSWQSHASKASGG